MEYLSNDISRCENKQCKLSCRRLEPVKKSLFFDHTPTYMSYFHAKSIKGVCVFQIPYNKYGY
jgi:hypothetical protein